MDLSEAIDATDERVKAAKAVIEAALLACKENPGVLFTSEFVDAIKIIREDQCLWAVYRVRLKREKPNGVLLSDIDDLTAPPSDDSGNDSTAALLIDLVINNGSLFFDEQSDKSFLSTDIDGVNRCRGESHHQVVNIP